MPEPAEGGPAWVRTGRHRLAALVGAAAILVALAGGCGSSTHSAGPTTVPTDPSCPLSQAQAADLVGSDAVAVAPPDLGSAVTAPVQRCQYQAGSSTAQLSVFPGTDMITQLKSILGKAQPAPEVGPSAYCDAHQGTTDASVSCVFVARGDTMVLALSVPNADLTPELQTKVHTLASVLANKV